MIISNVLFQFTCSVSIQVNANFLLLRKKKKRNNNETLKYIKMKKQIKRKHYTQTIFILHKKLLEMIRKKKWNISKIFYKYRNEKIPQTHLRPGKSFSYFGFYFKSSWIFHPHISYVFGSQVSIYIWRERNVNITGAW